MSKTVHPAADLFPAMSEDEFLALVDDVRVNGLVEDIVLDADGRVVDGRHRTRACAVAGVAPRYTTLSPAVDVVTYVISKNLHRRHMSLEQRAFLAVKALPQYRAEAEKRRREAGGGTGRAGGDTRTVTPRGGEAIRDRVHAGEATQKAAEAVGVSRNSVERARLVAERAPNLVPRIESGEISLTEGALRAVGRDAPSEAKAPPMPVGMKRSVKRPDAELCRRATAQIRNAVDLAVPLGWASLDGSVRAEVVNDLRTARADLTRIVHRLEGATNA